MLEKFSQFIKRSVVAMLAKNGKKQRKNEAFMSPMKQSIKFEVCVHHDRIYSEKQILVCEVLFAHSSILFAKISLKKRQSPYLKLQNCKTRFSLCRINLKFLLQCDATFEDTFNVIQPSLGLCVS